MPATTRTRPSLGHTALVLSFSYLIVLIILCGVAGKVHSHQHIEEPLKHVLLPHESTDLAFLLILKIPHPFEKPQDLDSVGAQTYRPSQEVAIYSEHDDARALPETDVTIFPRNDDDNKKDWQAWVRKGKDLLDMLTCGTGPQSRWTSFDDLEKWGWTRDEGQAKYPGYIHEDVPKYLGDPKLAHELWEVADGHTEDTMNDDTLYYATDAKYENFYSSSLIISDSNYGPEVEGPFQNPPVDGKEHPFPKLGRLSDIMFLEFQQRMGDLRKSTKGLKGQLQAGIVNRHTKTIVKKALNDDSEAWPTWPGQEFLSDTEGFSALLASPNGRGKFNRHILPG